MAFNYATFSKNEQELFAALGLPFLILLIYGNRKSERSAHSMKKARPFLQSRSCPPWHGMCVDGKRRTTSFFHRKEGQMSFFYETEVEWKGERRGNVRSPNLPALEVVAPPEFQGHEGGWTPEHLYVASVSSCFMTTFLALAQNSKLEIVSFSVSARGKLDKVEGVGYQVTEIVLRPRLVIRESRDLERAARILEKAEKSCFISNSIKTAIKLEPEIYHAQSPAYPCPPVSGIPS
jgi:peroxiredoxin-like protein